ncbi:MAG: DUF4340 domain-containing protein, partial [Chthoniobacterales bacterium]
GLRITSGSEFIELTRQADGWSVGPAPEDRADAARVGELLMTIADLTIHDTIPAAEIRSEKDLKPFGLSNPRNHVETVGSDPVKISFGKEAVGEGRIYAQVAGDNSVYVVPNPMEDTTLLSKQGLRDRRLTRYDANRIDSLILRRANGELEIQRTPKGWDLIRPLRATADTEKIGDLLNGLLGAEIRSFSTDSKLTPPGPDQPESTEVVFFPDDAEQPERLWLREDIDEDGNPITTVNYPARASTFVLDAGYARLAALTPEQVRSRKLLLLNLDTVDVIRVEDGGSPVALWRRENGLWKRDGTGATTPSDGVAAVVSRLLNESVSEYQPATEDALQNAQIHDAGLAIFFDAMVSENTPEAAAGRHPVSQLKIGTLEAPETFVQVNMDPEICRIPSASIREFLDWAKSTGPETVPSRPAP